MDAKENASMIARTKRNAIVRDLKAPSDLLIAQ